MDNTNETMIEEGVIETDSFFLTKSDFDEVKGRLKLQNPSDLDNFFPNENDVVVLNFTQHSTPLIRGLEIISNGDFVPFWQKRFEKEGVEKEQIKEAFLQWMR